MLRCISPAQSSLYQSRFEPVSWLRKGTTLGTALDWHLHQDCFLISWDDVRVLLWQAMVKNNTLPFLFDNQLPTRFGVLPRYAKNEDAIRWFEVPAVMMFHVANAWQDGNTIKLYSCCFDQVRPLGFCETTAKLLLVHSAGVCANDQ